MTARTKAKSAAKKAAPGKTSSAKTSSAKPAKQALPAKRTKKKPEILVERIGHCTLYRGDCRAIMQALPEASVHATVCDPPYGLSSEPNMVEVLEHWLNGDDFAGTAKGFMGTGWDSFVPGPATWREVARVLKPGGHLAAFSGSRTYDLMTLAIRLSGLHLRDQAMWLYGSGFPKSLDVSKDIDKRGGYGEAGLASQFKAMRSGRWGNITSGARKALPSSMTRKHGQAGGRRSSPPMSQSRSPASRSLRDPFPATF